MHENQHHIKQRVVNTLVICDVGHQQIQISLRRNTSPLKPRYQTGEPKPTRSNLRARPSVSVEFLQRGPTVSGVGGLLLDATEAALPKTGVRGGGRSAMPSEKASRMRSSC